MENRCELIVWQPRLRLLLSLRRQNASGDGDYREPLVFLRSQLVLEDYYFLRRQAGQVDGFVVVVNYRPFLAFIIGLFPVHVDLGFEL